MVASRNNLKTIRHKQRTMLEELSRASGVPVSRLCDIETWGIVPRTATQERIAAALNVAPADIWPPREATR